MKKDGRWLFSLWMTVAACACGTSSADDRAHDANDPAHAGEQPASDGDAPKGPATKLFGVWKVAGKDSTGAYEGQAEIASTAEGSIAFTRVIRYPNVVVEGDRELWWVW